MIRILFTKYEVLRLVNLKELRFELIFSCLFLLFAVQNERFSEEEGLDPLKNEGEGCDPPISDQGEVCEPWKNLEEVG